MLTNKAIATAVVTALIGQAAAFNSHRHLHRQVEKQLDKRALETDWVTHWETVYVTAGQEPQPTAESKPEDKAAPPPAPEPITTSTTSIVVEPTQPPAPVAEEKVQPTTLATQVKPAEPSPEPVAEQPKPEEPKPSAGVDVGVDVGAPVVENPAKPSKTKEATPKPSSGGSSSSDAPFSSKRGIAYNNAALANLFGTTCTSCTWAWNWGSSSSGLEGVSFVPMLWGDALEHTDHWDEDCEAAISSGSKAIFSFNEPDRHDQAATPAAEAAAAHAKYMNKYSGDVLVGSPSVTNSDQDGEGLQYLQEFMDACHAQEGGCAIDFCQIHWYHYAEFADTLYDHIKQAHEICDDKPIWLTEFAPLDPEPSVKDNFMKTVIPELDKIEYLHAYSYFMVSLENLMESDTALSSFGELYASV